MRVLTRQEWNEIIQEVNDVLQNPPEDSDCEPIDTIEEVGENHIWTFGDIEEVQNKLKETCEDISFSDTPDKWKESIITEINDAIGQAWCDCEDECTEEDTAALRAEHEAETFIFNAPLRVSTDCNGDPSEPNISVSGLINGMQIAIPGGVNRFWQFIRKNVRNGGGVFTTVILTGTLECDGTVFYEGSHMISEASGAYVACGVDCGNETCALAIADAEEFIASDDAFYSDYYIRLDADQADCVDCAELENPGGGEGEGEGEGG
jgi:hypothetical protein